MPLIPAQHVDERDTLSLRLDRPVHERLKQYAEFIHSPKDYIISQALSQLVSQGQGVCHLARGETCNVCGVAAVRRTRDDGAIRARRHASTVWSGGLIVRTLVENRELVSGSVAAAVSVGAWMR